MMKKRNILVMGLVALALLSSIGIAAAAPENLETTLAGADVNTRGSIGPDHSLYGLRIAFEDLDESFTFNESELLEKQVNHADLRLAELKQELSENRTESAGRVLELYRQKLNQTETALGQYTPNGTGALTKASGPAWEHAREMIEKHQAVLENLLSEHPDSPGLGRAYNNSLELKQKFQNRLEQGPDVRTGQVPGDGSVSSGRQATREFTGNNGNNTAIGNRGTIREMSGNRTEIQGNTRIRDNGVADNMSRQHPGMNQNVSGGQDRSQIPGQPPSVNQTADNRPQPATGKAGQNGQGNTRDIAGNRQDGNTVNPGNNNGATPGPARTTGNQGGQGQGADQRVRNR